MANTTLTWTTVDQEAASLGATSAARIKWRQKRRGVPPGWRIKIVESLMSRGIPVALADFDRLPVNPGRVAA